MKDLISALKIELQNHPKMSRVTVKAFGPAGVIPQSMPYVNILPRSKVRERVFLIGEASGSQQYDTDPEVEIHCVASHMESMEEAFEALEDIVNDVLEILADVSAATLGVDWKEASVDEYDNTDYEGHNYYGAVIVLKGKDHESYS